MAKEKRVYFLYTTPPLSFSLARHRDTKHATPHYLMEGTIGVKYTCYMALPCAREKEISLRSVSHFALEDRNLSIHTDQPTGWSEEDRDTRESHRAKDWASKSKQARGHLEKTTDSLCICVSVALLSSHHFNYILCAHRITTSYYMWGFNNNKKTKLYPLSKWKMLLTCILVLDFSHGKCHFLLSPLSVASCVSQGDQCLMADCM